MDPGRAGTAAQADPGTLSDMVSGPRKWTSGSVQVYKALALVCRM